MAKIKSYTDIEQSKKLAEILPIESADMNYATWTILNGEFIVSQNQGDTIESLQEDFGNQIIPCWNLAALLDVLPEIQGSKPIIALDDNYITYPHMSGLHTKADNLVDACYEMIVRLHELKML